MIPTCRYLHWDSNFWGFPVAMLEGSLLLDVKAETLMNWCHANKIRCLYFAADGSNAETLQQAYESGFIFVDVRIDLECDAPTRTAMSPANLLVRRVVETDLVSTKAIARSAHQDTRFFKDLNFERSRCAMLYEKWIERDFEVGQVLGFFPDQRADAVGYVTFTQESPEVARIGLIAVTESLRGCGGGRMLLNAAISAAAELGAKKIRVATQGTNVAALKLYEKAGFRVWPLQVASWLGFTTTFFGLIIFKYVITNFFLNGSNVASFPFFASIIAIFCGAKMFTLDVMGEYLARMHFRLLDRPAYVISKNLE